MMETIAFSSLLIGMCFATFCGPGCSGREHIAFSSLLIGMCFATQNS